MPEGDLIRLSQSHLNLLSTCPPRFQQVYIDCLGSLPEPEQQDSMKWGSRFHLLMQQRELALPIEPLLATDLELDKSLTALIQEAPELKPDLNVWREAEHCRTLSWGDFLFTAIYDLLIAEVDRAVIFDWKTQRKPPKPQNLKANWQTRLYLYLLAETSEYEPEQIEMTYWFVKSGKLTKITFTYDKRQHRQTEQDLNILLTDLKTWLQDYQQLQIDFPHQPNCQASCPFYANFAQVNETAANSSEILQSLDNIEEVPI